MRCMVYHAVEVSVADWNEHPRPFIWHKTPDQFFGNLTGYLNRIPNSGLLYGVTSCQPLLIGSGSPLPASALHQAVNPEALVTG